MRRLTITLPEERYRALKEGNPLLVTGDNLLLRDESMEGRIITPKAFAAGL